MRASRCIDQPYCQTVRWTRSFPGSEDDEEPDDHDDDDDHHEPPPEPKGTEVELGAPLAQDKLLDAQWARRIGDGVEALENDLEEKFVKGGGKGGQAVNKSNNCVQIKHIPTGTVVRCHATRSREQNRRVARQILWEKLEHRVRGEESKIGREMSRERARKAKRKRRIEKAKKYKSLRDRAFWEG